MHRVPTGAWGAPHIRIELGSNLATIDYDCANGTINGPFTIDSSGRFSWRGTHNQEHHGPVRLNEQRDGEPVIYSGWVKGNTMRLTIRLADTKDELGTYTLTRGRSGRVFKCA